jgi:large subunit ribosomal protein L4
MPTTTLFAKDGSEAGTVELPDGLFAAPVNNAVMHQAVTAQLNARRLGTSNTRTRGMVRGGGKKPYRQKGTGRARQGTRTAPHYAGGGVVFGPHPRSYEQRFPRRMKRLALKGALTAKFDGGAIRVVQDLALDEIKTRVLAGYLTALQADGKVLVIAPSRDERLELSVRNLPTVNVILADSLNIVDVLNADVVLITEPAITTMSEVYA